MGSVRLLSVDNNQWRQFTLKDSRLGETADLRPIGVGVKEVPPLPLYIYRSQDKGMRSL